MTAMRRTLGALLLAVALLNGGAAAAPLAATPAARRADDLLAPRDFDVGWRNAGRRASIDFQTGGWTGVTAASFSEDDNDKNTADAVTSLLLSELRLWSRVWLRDGSNAHVRLRAVGYDFGTPPGFSAPRLPNRGFDLDLAYVDTKLLGVSHRIGRQYIRYGGGLVLAGTLDAVRSYRQRGNFGINGFFGKNKPQELDLDPNIGGPHRIFNGLDVTYQRADDSKLFAYILTERDKSAQPAGISVAGQAFHYDSDYVGLGLDGRFSGHVDYHVEGIYQQGESFALGAGAAARPNDIRAHAGLGTLTYHDDRPMRPVLTAEYLFGSGDSGRLPGVSTVSANTPGRDDGNFLGFGRYDLGIALNPRLSNLRVLRLGASAKPWDDSPDFEDLTVGGKLSFYRKDDATGGISDPQATLPSDDVGEALDLFLGWRFFSDLAWTLQYGRFYPGAAYAAGAADSTRTLYSNVTWSF